MGSILIVRRVDLMHTPSGFQKYVKDHFKEMELVGVPVYFASERFGWNWEDEESRRRGQTRGIAPSAFWCPEQYNEGLPPGQKLDDWVKANDTKLVTRLHVVDERDADTDFYEDD